MRTNYCLVFDAHQDLAFNILNFNRDYTQSAAEIRQQEHDIKSEAPNQIGDTLLGWQDYLKGQVAVIFATLFAAPLRRNPWDWNTQHYANRAQAYDRYRSQLDEYHRLADEHADKFLLIQVQKDLVDVLTPWQRKETENLKVGLVVLMEGAEGIREPAELEMWWEEGVRLIGPAWAGTRFCGGTGEPGPLTKEGYALLDAMASFGFVLDLSHMDERAALEALDHYPGTIIVSHANARALLQGSDSNRHLTDRQIAGVLERDGVIGVVPYNKFLQVGWKTVDGRLAVSLQQVVEHIDYICQMAGDAKHVGIGSDFDGGFGWQSVPAEINTIADLQKLVPLLEKRGYSSEDIARIMGYNWRSVLEKVLPEVV